MAKRTRTPDIAGPRKPERFAARIEATAWNLPGSQKVRASGGIESESVLHESLEIPFSIGGEGQAEHVAVWEPDPDRLIDRDNMKSAWSREECGAATDDRRHFRGGVINGGPPADHQEPAIRIPSKLPKPRGEIGRSDGDGTVEPIAHQPDRGFARRRCVNGQCDQCQKKCAKSGPKHAVKLENP